MLLSCSRPPGPSPASTSSSLTTASLNSIMVSLRRRRHLGLCSGKSSFPVEPSGSTQNCNTVGRPNLNAKSFGVHPMLSHLSLGNTINVSEFSVGPSKASASTSSKEDSNHYYPDSETNNTRYTGFYLRDDIRSLDRLSYLIENVCPILNEHEVSCSEKHAREQQVDGYGHEACLMEIPAVVPEHKPFTKKPTKPKWFKL